MRDGAAGGATAMGCPECGAAWTATRTCRDCFDALLAYENEHPPAFGAVHHLTVASYFLQHPTGYASATLEIWRELIADAMAGRATPRELLRRAGRRFAGATRVRDPGAGVPAGWPRTWPITVDGVLRPDERPPTDEYIARARRWATATLDTLGHDAPRARTTSERRS